MLKEGKCRRVKTTRGVIINEINSAGAGVGGSRKDTAGEIEAAASVIIWIPELKMTS